jgi:hypothetical protein
MNHIGWLVRNRHLLWSLRTEALISLLTDGRYLFKPIEDGLVEVPGQYVPQQRSCNITAVRREIDKGDSHARFFST